MSFIEAYYLDSEQSSSLDLQESFLLEMRSNLEYSCHTVTNIKHG